MFSDVFLFGFVNFFCSFRSLSVLKHTTIKLLIVDFLIRYALMQDALFKYPNQFASTIVFGCVVESLGNSLIYVD